MLALYSILYFGQNFIQKKNYWSPKGEEPMVTWGPGTQHIKMHHEQSKHEVL